MAENGGSRPVRVCVRVRPINAREAASGQPPVVACADPTTLELMTPGVGDDAPVCAAHLAVIARLAVATNAALVAVTLDTPLLARAPGATRVWVFVALQVGPHSFGCLPARRLSHPCRRATPRTTVCALRRHERHRARDARRAA